MSSIVRTPAHIGAAIRRQLKLMSITQTELGEKTKLRQATISQIENGDGSVRLKTLTDVLAALNLEFVIQERSSGRGIEDLF